MPTPGLVVAPLTPFTVDPKVDEQALAHFHSKTGTKP